MMKKVSFILLGVYTPLLLYWMFFGFGREYDPQAAYRYNIVPFHTITDFALMRVGGRMDQWINLFGNIAVFVPFGVFIPLITSYTWQAFMIRFGLGILMIEIVQMLSKRGTFDIDDLILNSIGATIGWCLWRYISMFSQRSS